MLQSFEVFLVYFDESLHTVTLDTVVFWFPAISHREQIARAWSCPEREQPVTRALIFFSLFQHFCTRRAARFSLNLNEKQLLFLGHVSIAKGNLS